MPLLLLLFGCLTELLSFVGSIFLGKRIDFNLVIILGDIIVVLLYGIGGVTLDVDISEDIIVVHCWDGISGGQGGG